MSKFARIPQKDSGYIPTLDGWRALAIGFVLLDHSPTIGIGRLSTFKFHYLGTFGVQIFFALSGFLITSRLLDEEQRAGGLHLKGFYIRRFMRIQPVALVYFACVTVLTLLHRLPAAWKPLLAAIFFVRNLVSLHGGATTWPTAHFWSLSVEEQFYFVLPAMLLLVRRHRGRLLLGAALADMAWYVYSWHAHHWEMPFLEFRTDMCCHVLLLGAAVAMLIRRPEVARFYQRFVQAWIVLPVVLLMLPIGSPVHRLLFVTPTFLILSTVMHPRGWMGRFLETKPMRYLGRISYSLYVWQALYLSAFFAPTLRTFGDMTRLWVVWPASFVTAIASYHLLEKPLMRLGHRLAHPATAGHADLDVPASPTPVLDRVPLISVPQRSPEYAMPPREQHGQRAPLPQPSRNQR